MSQPLCFTPRKDPCALCCRGEQVGHLGPRLPHDPPPHAPCRSHKDGQGPPRHHPQPGLLAPAGRPGQRPEDEEECVKDDERLCGGSRVCAALTGPRCPLSGRDGALCTVQTLGSLWFTCNWPWVSCSAKGGSPDMRAIVVKHKPSACNPATSVSLLHRLLPSLLAPRCLRRDSAPRFGLISPCWLPEAFKASFSQVVDAFAKPVPFLPPRRLKLCVFLVLFPICSWSV